MRLKLNSFTSSELESRSVLLTENLLHLIEFQNAKGISCFISMPKGEVNTTSIIDHILTSTTSVNDQRLFVPKVIGKRSADMMMIEVNGMNDLSLWNTNQWGIKEPPLPEGDSDITFSGVIDLVIVPGVIFDHSCHRMGHGKGYYDYFLSNLRKTNEIKGIRSPITIALCFDEQLLPEGENVPIEDHDVRLDYVITPTQVIKASS